MLTKNEKRIDELFDRLVPVEGKAPTVAGEIVRAMCRISYRFRNDGGHLGVGYGNETCNAAGRYLMRRAGRDARELVQAMWGLKSKVAYEALLDKLLAVVLAALDRHPEYERTANGTNMWSLQAPEDTQYEEDEDLW